MYSLSNIDYFIEAIKTPLRINEGLLLFILHRFKNPNGFVESRYNPHHITLEFVRAFEGTPLGYVGECRHCGRVHYIDRRKEMIKW